MLHGNIFHKISNCLQKPKYYLGNYLQNPNIILATIYKSPMLFWQLFTKSPILLWQLYFGIFYQKEKKKKNPKLLGKQLFYQSPNVIRQKNYIMLKTQNYSLEKSYFDILIPQTHRKYKFLMTYYPYFKTISFTKFQTVYKSPNTI